MSHRVDMRNLRDMRRAKLLQDDPQTGPVDMSTLAGIAAAIEQESARRYEELADLMDARGEAATAAAFRAMHQEELRHVEAVDKWTKSIAESVDSPDRFAWLLPAELASSWDDIARSALLTPYRAFALAVWNEERAFAFYSYLAAHATDDRVRAEAEMLAAEELLHAAALRRWRRLAWHRERREAMAPMAAPIDDVDGLERLLGQSWTGILACHRAVADRLREIGDPDSARFLEELAAAATPAGASTTESMAPTDSEREAIAASAASLPLLVIAQRPLEHLAERLEAVLETSQGELFDATVAAIDATVGLLSRLALRMPAPREA